MSLSAVRTRGETGGLCLAVSGDLLMSVLPPRNRVVGADHPKKSVPSLQAQRAPQLPRVAVEKAAVPLLSLSHS
jgi:hypothetical protein